MLHYVPHYPVIREEAESIKLRIVCDCSAKENCDLTSLNDCLETGPSLKPLLIDILLRNRMRCYCITGDIKKGFLQIQISKKDRDALRIFWYENLDSRFIKKYRFTRAIFGAGPSQGGGDCIKDLETFKSEIESIMKQGGFALHKWHSNVTSLESISNEIVNDSDGKLLPASRTNERILGVPWNKERDTLRIEFTPCMQVKEPITKRKILSAIKSAYNFLGLASPISITAKIIFSEICLRHLGWDHLIPEDIQKRWNAWVKTFSERSFLTVPRCVTTQDYQQVYLSGFADPTKVVICAAIHIVCLRKNGGVK